MIGERDFIQVSVIVVGIECSETAVLRLHAADPFGCAADRSFKALVAAFVHRVSDRRSIIQIRIVRIDKLERPSTALYRAPVKIPVLRSFQQLSFREPVEGFFNAGEAARISDRLKCDTGPGGIPYR